MVTLMQIGLVQNLMEAMRTVLVLKLMVDGLILIVPSLVPLYVKEYIKVSLYFNCKDYSRPKVVFLNRMQIYDYN